jgi:hypothetical protein
MEEEQPIQEKLEAKKNAVKISLGVLRALIIINVIYYLVKLWAGRAVGPLLLLPALICVVLGIIVYLYKRKLG